MVPSRATHHISKNFSKLSRDVFQQYFLHEDKNSLKISFLQECTSNLVTDFDFQLLTESFVTVHIEKTFMAEIILQFLERKLR